MIWSALWHQVGTLGDSDGVIEPELFSVHQLGEVTLENYDAVMLSQVMTLSSRELKAVAKYSKQGGALAVFLGQDSVSDRSGLNSFLPIEIKGVQAAGEYHFDPRGYRHPIVEPFRGQTHAGLLGVTITQYQRLDLLEVSPAPEVVLAFDTEDPALVIGKLGLGRVAVSALPGSLAVRTAERMPWSSFALSPSFLPVVRELVTFLVGDRWLQHRNLSVGTPAVFSTKSSTQTVEVQLPSGVRSPLPQLDAEDQGELTYYETNQPGIYRFSTDELERARFAVNLDGRDSDLKPIDETELPASVSKTVLEGSGVAIQRTTDFSFVRTLLAFALMLLLLEVGLAWLLGKGWG